MVWKSQTECVASAVKKSIIIASVSYHLRTIARPRKFNENLKKNTTETTKAIKMLKNRFGVICSLGWAHNDNTPSICRRHYDMEDPAAMASNPFVGEHFPPPMVLYHRPV